MRNHVAILTVVLITLPSGSRAQSLPPMTVHSTHASSLEPRPEAGANLVQNSGFDTDLGTWNPILSSTNLFLQEVVGAPASVKIEYRNAAGQIVGTSTETLPAFGLIQRNDVAPNASASVTITVDDKVEGKVIAFATPVDRASGDNWTVTDWRMFYGYGGGEPVVIPIVGSVRGANQTHFRTDVAVMNTGATAAPATLSYYGRAGERVERSVTLASKETREIGDVVGTLLGITGDSVGAIVVRPGAGANIAVTSRTYTTAAGQPGTYGTGVPTLGLSASLRPGEVRRIGGLEDATFTTISARRGASFRTNFGLVETAGGSAVIRATLRYTAASGSVSAASVQGQASKEYALAPNQLVLLNNIAKEILGESREANFGDLRSLQVEFQVLEGRAHVFVSSTDNGTGDSILRTE